MTIMIRTAGFFLLREEALHCCGRMPKNTVHMLASKTVQSALPVVNVTSLWFRTVVVVGESFRTVIFVVVDGDGRT